MTDETGEAIDARARVVGRARSELGEQDPDKYWAVVCPALMGHEHDVAWCGGFVLWCLRQEGVCSWDWEIGKGFVWRLKATALPEPGDVAVFKKSPSGSVLWHHAIVERCDGGRVYTIDGNSMPAPREGVTAKDRPIDTNVTFYSIGSLLED